MNSEECGVMLCVVLCMKRIVLCLSFVIMLCVIVLRPSTASYTARSSNTHYLSHSPTLPLSHSLSLPLSSCPRVLESSCPRVQSWVRSMGMSPSDKEGGSLWVDMLGDAISRDLEPTVEDGGALWKVRFRREICIS